MSEASLPVFEIGLNALSTVLDKAAAHAAAKKIDISVLLNSRLAPDMFALTRQVQIATDQAKTVPLGWLASSRQATRTMKRPWISSRRAWLKQSPI